MRNRTLNAAYNDRLSSPDAIVGAAFFTLLVLPANTMMQSVRERTSEFAVLKTLGFSDIGVLAIVLAESLLLCAIGAVVRPGDRRGS